MQGETGQSPKEAIVIFWAKAQVGAYYKHRLAQTPEEKRRAKNEEHEAFQALAKAVRRLPP